jgi:hypothetical protein
MNPNDKLHGLTEVLISLMQPLCLLMLWLCGRIPAKTMDVVGYVQRGDSRHIFSMRKANEREQARFG